MVIVGDFSVEFGCFTIRYISVFIPVHTQGPTLGLGRCETCTGLEDKGTNIEGHGETTIQYHHNPAG